MPLKFRTEIKEMFGKEYIKVFLLNMVDSSKVKTLLESLYCISRVNESNDGKDLTAYPTKLYTAVEADTEINATLVAFYSTNDKEDYREVENGGKFFREPSKESMSV